MGMQQGGSEVISSGGKGKLATTLVAVYLASARGILSTMQQKINAISGITHVGDS